MEGQHLMGTKRYIPKPEGTPAGALVPGEVITAKQAELLERRWRILRRTREGASRAEVAKELGTSQAVVSRELRRMLTEMDRESREDAHLIRAMISNDLLEVADIARRRVMEEGNLGAIDGYIKAMRAYIDLNGLQVKQDTPTVTVQWAGLPIPPPPGAIEATNLAEVVDVEDE